MSNILDLIQVSRPCFNLPTESLTVCTKKNAPGSLESPKVNFFSLRGTSTGPRSPWRTSCNHICPKALMDDQCGQNVEAHLPAHIGDGTCRNPPIHEIVTLGKSEHHQGICHCNLGLPTGKRRYTWTVVNCSTPVVECSGMCKAKGIEKCNSFVHPGNHT